MPVRVEQETCISCGSCISVCPTESLSLNADGKAECDVTTCIDCGACLPSCPTDSISEE